MSASNVNKVAGPRQVACQTADNDQIPVDHDVLRTSGTFKKMHDDLGLEAHDEFPGVFPVETVSTRTFKRVIEWCKEYKDAPELVVEKDPLTQECKWYEFTEYDKGFFNVPMPELLELVMAANYLDIPRLYHYACQAIAADIKGKSSREICGLLHQKCDLDSAQIRKTISDNPWLECPGAFTVAPIKNPVFVPNEVLVTIFEKLPREDLDRLQLVSTQFNGVIVGSSELSEQQGPLRVVTKVEFGTTLHGGRFTQETYVWPRDGATVTCPDYEELAKRLKFSVVEKLRYGTGEVCGASDADVKQLSALLPVKSSWKNAVVEVHIPSFPSSELFEFAFTQLFLCKEIKLNRERQLFAWSAAHMRLQAIAECNKLDISGVYHYEFNPAEILEWLEHEVPPEKKWNKPRQLILDACHIDRGIFGLLSALKTAFSTSNSPKPYGLRILGILYLGNPDEDLANEETHELLRIRAGDNDDILVTRA